MNDIPAASFAAAPAALVGGLLLAFLILRLGRGQFSGRLFGVALCIGVVMAMLILVIELPFHLQANPYGFSRVAIAFGFAGFPEEAAKMAATYFLLRPHYLRRNARDLVVGAAAAALGFALFENFLYVAGAGEHWGQMAFGRAITAVPFHVMEGMIGAYAIARAEFAATSFRAAARIGAIWIVASALHGLYDLMFFILRAPRPYPAVLEDLARRANVAAPTIPYSLLLSAVLAVCALSFLSIRALDRPPLASPEILPGVGRAGPRRLARLLFARSTAWVVAGLLLVAALGLTGLALTLSFVADAAAPLLVILVATACPVTIALMLLRFQPPARVKALANPFPRPRSPIWRRPRSIVALLAVALVGFGAYRWGAAPVRELVAARILFNGLQSEMKGDHEAAIREYDKALAVDPTFADALAKRAAANVALDRKDLALSDLDDAVLMQPRNVAFLVQRAQLHRLMHATQIAIADLDRALALAPKSSEIWAERAQANAEAGYLSREEEDLARAFELGPDNPIVLNVQGSLLIRRGDYEGAIKVFDEALRKNSTDGNALFYRGRAWLYLGFAQKAAADFQAANAIASEPYPALWLHLARTRIGEDARSELQARLLQPRGGTWPGPVLRYFTGQMAAKEAKAAAENDDQRCEADFYEGALYVSQGKADLATPLFEAAKAECPIDFVEYEGAIAELNRPARNSDAAPSGANAGESADSVAAAADAGINVASGDARANQAPPAAVVIEAKSAVVRSASAGVTVTLGQTGYRGTAFWQFTDRGAQDSELSAILLFDSAAIHGLLTLKRKAAGSATQYELSFTTLAADLQAPPLSAMGSFLDAPVIVRSQGPPVVMATSMFTRGEGATFRTRIAKENIAQAMSDLASGSQFVISSAGTGQQKVVLRFDLNAKTAELSRLAAAVWR